MKTLSNKELNTVKGGGNRGGFAVGGISPTIDDATSQDLDQQTEGNRGGFAVGGISPT